MTTPMTNERFLDRWEAFKGEPQQVSGAWLLCDAVRALPGSEAVLAEEAAWAVKFSEKPPAPPIPEGGNPLNVTYYSQLDNYTDPTGTCYSSACAMMLKYLKPDAIKSDDAYLARVLSFGPSTDPNSQIKALKSYGLDCAFYTNFNKQDIIKRIDKGIPVPCGFLHHGTPQNPTGGGHWLCAIGYTSNGVIVHDPYGDCNLSTGQYGSENGAKLTYSDANWTNTRWMPDGPGSGWSISPVSI